MFGRLTKNLHKLLPLSVLFVPYLYNQHKVKLEQKPVTPSLQTSTIEIAFSSPSSRIKFVEDLTQYIEKQSKKGRSVIFYEMRGDQFIDSQVIALAQEFISTCSSKISEDYEFVFLKNISQPFENEQHYLILYGVHGEKVINIESYLNKNREKPYIKVNHKLLMKRLVEGLNLFKEVSLENINEELSSIDLNNKYSALFTVAAENKQVEKAKHQLQSYLKENDVRDKTLNRYVVRDEQTQTLLGLGSDKNTNKVYLLVAESNNLKKKFKEAANFFSINGKKYTYVDVNANLNEIFVFPPITKALKPEDLVLNVYMNKNKDSGVLESSLYEELSKPQYEAYIKGIYYSSEVEKAAITLQASDYSKMSLKAYEKNTKLSKQQIKETLLNTYEWNLSIKTKEDINTDNIINWLKESQGPNKFANQYFKSQTSTPVWARQITGQEYKEVRDSQSDKVIYHFSQHCHGCKKFGGMYEQFAKNKRINTPNVNFYRINNDNNKSEGVRNFNSTPVFVFYKKGYTNPFVYRMPIFTQSLFDSFLKITSEVKLIEQQKFHNHQAEHKSAEPLLSELLSKVVV